VASAFRFDYQSVRNDRDFVMARDHRTLLSESNTDWDKAWDAVNRLGVARKRLESDTGAIAAERQTEPVETMRPRPLHRPVAVWILIGALWISIGMIVSAAIVTVAFLA
jgi:hypothetical protein